MHKNKSHEELTNAFKKTLSDQLGVDEQEIDLDDSLSLDLHMSAADIVDFVHALNERGIDATNVDLTTVETVNDFIEEISSKTFLE